MNSSSRTNLRLHLMREQLMMEKGQTMGNSESTNTNQTMGSTSAPRAINNPTETSCAGSSADSSGDSKASPITISQAIRFHGNRLVHLPAQIIHVQQQHESSTDEMGRRNLTLSSSLPPGLPQNSSPKMTGVMKTANMEYTKNPQYTGVQYQERRVPSGSTSRHSPDEMSPGGYGDSPQSTSFTSAQSELDDIIIGEILSMEEEQQQQRDHQAIMGLKVPGSSSYANNLESLLIGGRRIPFDRQVSNSAPTSTIDIKGLIQDEMMEEHDPVRDRRKKDIHNMIERRRRYNINDRIKELGSLLPKACTEDLKLNKGTILKASVEYIRILRRDQEKSHHILQRYHGVEEENKLMALRIQELEESLSHHGIPVPQFETSTESSSTFTIPNSTMASGRGQLTDRPIKPEPIDDDQTPQPRPNQQAPSFPVYTTMAQPLPPTQMLAEPNLGQSSSHHQSDRMGDYSTAGMMPQNYQSQISNDTQFSSFYNSAIYGNSGGVLETPPVVSNNMSLFGDRRGPSGLVNEQQQRQQVNEMGMDRGNGVGQSTGNTVGALVSSSTAALMSSADPLMSDSRLISSQMASPEIHWESQTFSPDGEQMEFTNQ